MPCDRHPHEGNGRSDLGRVQHVRLRPRVLARTGDGREGGPHRVGGRAPVVERETLAPPEVDPALVVQRLHPQAHVVVAGATGHGETIEAEHVEPRPSAIHGVPDLEFLHRRRTRHRCEERRVGAFSEVARQNAELVVDVDLSLVHVASASLGRPSRVAVAASLVALVHLEGDGGEEPSARGVGPQPVLVCAEQARPKRLALQHDGVLGALQGPRGQGLLLRPCRGQQPSPHGPGEEPSRRPQAMHAASSRPEPREPSGPGQGTPPVGTKAPPLQAGAFALGAARRCRVHVAATRAPPRSLGAVRGGARGYTDCFRTPAPGEDMPTANPPRRLAGIEVSGPLRLGALGEGYAGHDGSVLKLLRPGEERVGEPLAARVALPFADAGTGEGERLLRAAPPLPELVCLGVLVGGSPLQAECIRASAVLDRGGRLGRRLRLTDVTARARLLASLAKAVAELHSQGCHLSFVTPWNVVVREGRLSLLDDAVALDPTDDAFDPTSLHDDVVAYLAPELRDAIAARQPLPAGPAADTYAWAATARSAFLNRCCTSWPERHTRVSAAVDELLHACLAARPELRPPLAEAAVRLEALIEADAVAYTPPTPWLAAINTALGIFLLVGLGLLFRDAFIEPQAVVARRAFAEAAAMTDLDAREAALEQAYELRDGRRVLIPPARRLLALGDFLRWQASGAKDSAALDAALLRLEVDVAGEHRDGLAWGARTVAGVLRRWEGRSPEDVRSGERLLAQVAREATAPELRALATLAARLDPCSAGPAAGDPALARAALAGGARGGPLAGAFPLVPGTPPVSLDAAWVAQLVGGKALSVLDAPGGLEALRRAQASVPIFATEAALALELLRRGRDLDQAQALLERALKRRDVGELRLARGRLALARAHRDGSTAAFDRAEELLAAVAERPEPLASPTGDPRTLAAQAQELRDEAAFYGALSLLRRENALPQAEARLSGLLSVHKRDRSWKQRYLLDARIALGLCLVRLGRAEEAEQDLLCAFAERNPLRGWAPLPPLRPEPPSRDRVRILRGLLEPLLARLTEVRSLAGGDPGSASVLVRDLAVRVEELLALPEARDALGPGGVELARASLATTRALLRPGGGVAAFEGARRAAAGARAAAQPGSEPWVRAQRLLLEIYRAQRARARSPRERLAPRLFAALDRQTLPEDLPRPLAEELETALAELVGGDDLRAELEAYVAGLLPGLERASPRSAPPSRGDDPTLDRLALQLASEGPGGGASPRELARRGLCLAHLCWFQGDPACVSAATKALARLGADDRSELARRLWFLIGTVALRRPDFVRGCSFPSDLDGAEPAGLAREALARAAGAKDFADLARRLRAGNLRPTPLPGDEQGPRELLSEALLGAWRERLPANVLPTVALAEAAAAERDLWLAAALSPRSAAAQLALARVRLAGAAGNAKRLRQAALGARKALALATGDGPSALATRAEAARVYCTAILARSGDAALAKTLREARAGARAAAQLRERDPAAFVRHAASAALYWEARVGLARARRGLPGAREEAAAAYERFVLALGDADPPPEARNYRRERVEIEKLQARGRR